MFDSSDLIFFILDLFVWCYHVRICSVCFLFILKVEVGSCYLFVFIIIENIYCGDLVASADNTAIEQRGEIYIVINL